MRIRSRRNLADRLRNEDGNILITVILVSLVVGMLGSLALTTGTQADRSSASDRNREQALGVAEAGIHKVTARISAQAQGLDTTAPNFWALAPGQSLPTGCPPGGSCAAARADAAYSFTTPEGSYWYWVTRTEDGFVVDAESTAGEGALDRARHIQVKLVPSTRFPDSKVYAMFSYTSIEVENNDQILYGDVFANDNVTINSSNHSTAADPTLQGSVTAARGWIRLGSNTYINGNAWSGGPSYENGWSIRMESSATVSGWAKASATVTPASCSDNNYDVDMGNNAKILGNVTTLGTRTGSGSVGSLQANTCSAAHPTQPLPVFTFNRDNYDQSTYHEFGSVSAFQTWLATNSSDFKGTFVVNDATPSQTNRINLTGAVLTGSATIVTNAPIYTANLSDASTPVNSELVLVSRYHPPVATGCNTSHDTSDCAVHLKNGFSTDATGACRVATLIYADQGPVAIKNNSTFCGSIISDGILVKNSQKINYDPRVNRIVGFGPSTYVIDEWQDLPVG